MVVNSNGAYASTPIVGQDRLYYRNTFQYCCGAAAPMLNIGGTLVGEAGPAIGSTSWTYAAPGSSDTGAGVMLASPVRTVYSVNPSSDIQLGYGEVPGDEPFDGALAISFHEPYDDVAAGGDIGFSSNPSAHDAGIMIQWPSAPCREPTTARCVSMSAPAGAALYASFTDRELVRGTGTDLVLELLSRAPLKCQAPPSK